MYAVIKTGGKQYRVQQGDVIFVEKINAQADEQVTFEVFCSLATVTKPRSVPPW